MNNPLFDTLFRPTTLPDPAPAGEQATPVPTNASDPPVRVRGTRTRAGNAMKRTRDALMRGAARAVATDGTKITMSQVAVAAGVAKATLYNHFRTREAVLAALVLDQIDALIAEQQGKPLDTALADTALAISAHPVVRGLARVEPAVLVALAHRDDASEGWRRVQAGVEAVLATAGRSGADTVLRWVASFVVTPGDARTIEADVAVLMAGLPSSAPA